MELAETIVAQVRAVIEHEVPMDRHAYPIGLKLEKGALVVEGNVPHIGLKRKILRTVRTVKNVAEVEDRVCVILPERMGDGATRDAVAKRLLDDIDFQNCDLLVLVKNHLEVLRQTHDNSSGEIILAVQDGIVTLFGRVISLSHKRLAEVLAWWGGGCRNVVNKLDVVPGEEDNDDELADALRLVLETDPYVHAEQVGIKTKRDVVTLEGVVASMAERVRAEDDAWYLHGVEEVINRIEVRP